MNPKQMVRQMQEMQEKMVRELDAMRIEGSAGGGIVTATVNGQKDLIAVRMSKEAITPDDPEMLQDLIVAAVSEAARKAGEVQQEKLLGLTGGLKIPGLF